MTLSDFGWVKYPFGMVVLVVYGAILGLPYMAMARRHLPSYTLLLGPQVGLAWLIVGVSLWGFAGSELHGWMLYLIGLVVLVVVGAATWRRRAALGPIRPQLKELAIGAVPWLIGIVVVTLYLLPAISSDLLPTGYVTSFTISNSDLGSYLGEATNMAKAGFDNAGYYFHWNAGTDPSTLAAKTDHTGASALMASASALLHLPVWKVATITLMTMAASVIVGGIALARSFAASTRMALVIGTFGGASILLWYLATNFFIAQFICLALLIPQLVLVQAATRVGFDWRLILSLGPLAAATWVASPEVEVTGIVLVAGLIGARAVAGLIAREPVRATIWPRLWSDAVRYAGALALTAVLTFPFISDLIDRFDRISAGGIVGWTLNLANAPANLVGINDALGAPGTALATVITVVVAVALVAAFVWAVVRRDWTSLVAGLLAAGMIAFCIAGALKWGFGRYQSWKLIVTLSAPFAVVALVLLLRPLRDQWRVAALAFVVALIGINVANGADTWVPFRTDKAAVQANAFPLELSDLLKSEPLQRQPAINVYLPNEWLTMAAPAVYEKRAAMSSPSYLSEGQPGPHPYSCSLFDRAIYKPRKPHKVVLLTEHYVLVATPKCA